MLHIFCFQKQTGTKASLQYPLHMKTEFWQFSFYPTP